MSLIIKSLFPQTTERVLRDAIATFGNNAQIDVAIEELSELIKALIKDRRYNTKETRVNVHEEIADVIIMLKQLLIMYAAEGEVLFTITSKLSRLRNFIEENTNQAKDDNINDVITKE